MALNKTLGKPVIYNYCVNRVFIILRVHSSPEGSIVRRWRKMGWAERVVHVETIGDTQKVKLEGKLLFYMTIRK